MKNILFILFAGALLSGCIGSGKKQSTQDASAPAIVTDAADWEKVFRRIDATEIPDNPIRLIGSDWMLVTSGTPASFNTMTASWGALGEIWGKHIAIITIRNIRYTNQFLERNDTYTLSFFDERYRDKLLMLGTKSGRDSDKIAESGLTPVQTPVGSMSFGEARMVLECRKLYSDPLSRESMIPEIAGQFAKDDGEYHILYIGEIVNVWIR